MSHRNAAAKTTNTGSILLERTENEALFRLLGRGCVTAATAVVQLYLSQKPDDSKWNKICTGVATFIKDNVNRSYYIKIYNIVKETLVWQQELYKEFLYKSPKDFFHTFECDNGMAGLNFANTDEANTFKGVILSKIASRSERSTQRKQLNNAITLPPPPPPTSSLPTPTTGVRGPPTAPNVLSIPRDVKSTSTDNKKKEKKNKKGKAQKKTLTKKDISEPSDFRQVGHVGFDPLGGFKVTNMDPDMERLFQSVGIKTEDGVDKETFSFISDFVEKHGGMNVVKNEISRHPLPPTPAKPGRSLPSIPETGARPGLPPPKPPKGGGPPPPPPPPPPPIGGAPPPPPPPIGGGPPSSPVPPPTPTQKPSLSSGRANLMESIVQSGQSGLKKVERTETAKRPSVDDGDGIVGALAKALADRQKAFRGSDDEDSNSDGSDVDTEDEWSD